MYLASSETTFGHYRLHSYLLRIVRVGQFVLREVYGCGSALRVLIGGFTDMEYSLFFCVF